MKTTNFLLHCTIIFPFFIHHYVVYCTKLQFHTVYFEISILVDHSRLQNKRIWTNTYQCQKLTSFSCIFKKKYQKFFDEKWSRLFAVIRENKWSSFSKEKYAIGCCYLLL